jgi:hypothetical protein
MICVGSMPKEDVKKLLINTTIERLMVTAGICHCPDCRKIIHKALLENAVESSNMRL